MRHVLAGIAGLLLGAAAAAGIVYVNPITANRGAPAAGDWQLSYSFPEPGVLVHTHGGRLPLERRPADVPELWEETIRSGAVTSMRLADGRDGGSVWATRISVPSTRTNLVFNGVVVGDYWLISKPGTGSLFMAANTNLWPALKDTYLRVDVLGRPWRGPAAYSPTLRAEGLPAVYGATGRFAGVEGRGIERFEVGAYGADGLETLSGRLLLEFDGQGPFAEPDVD